MTDPVTLREVAQLRQSVARLEALVIQLERSFDMARRPNPAFAGAALERENERLMALLRAHPPPRPAMLPQRRLRLAAAQSWRCAICDQLLSEAFHADHIVPFSVAFDDSDANVQITCVPCHLEKTSVENSSKRREP